MFQHFPASLGVLVDWQVVGYHISYHYRRNQIVMQDLPSRTAEFMALFRALESARPALHPLFKDRFASAFLSCGLRLAAGLARIPGIYNLFAGIIDRRWPGAGTSGIARTRVLDDLTIKALSSGATQVVLLGAGFDSRPYRLAGMERTGVYEVDHPGTSARRQSIIKGLFGFIPTNVKFVPLDFNKDELDIRLNEAGFDFACQTIIIWEGVSSYLSPEAVDNTLSWCGRAAVSQEVVFTYIEEKVIAHPEEFYGANKIGSLLHGVGGKWTFGINPGLSAYLKKRHLSLEVDLNATQYREKLFGNRSHKMRGYEFYHVAVASFGTWVSSAVNTEMLAERPLYCWADLPQKGSTKL
jgi:methyltransferase (TIGR00027 family)